MIVGNKMDRKVMEAKEALNRERQMEAMRAIVLWCVVVRTGEMETPLLAEKLTIRETTVASLDPMSGMMTILPLSGITAVVHAPDAPEDVQKAADALRLAVWR